MRHEFKTQQSYGIETIKIIRVGATECASHSDAAKPCGPFGYSRGRSETIMGTLYKDCIVQARIKISGNRGYKLTDSKRHWSR